MAAAGPAYTPPMKPPHASRRQPRAADAPPHDADGLTWAVLLGRWVEFARSSVALPGTGDGRRLRDSVPDLIMLQAVWFALEHLGELGAGERALGLDRAEEIGRASCRERVFPVV